MRTRVGLILSLSGLVGFGCGSSSSDNDGGSSTDAVVSTPDLGGSTSNPVDAGPTPDAPTGSHPDSSFFPSFPDGSIPSLPDGALNGLLDALAGATCADLAACCPTIALAPIKADCQSNYDMVKDKGDSACAFIVTAYRAAGQCK